jgi:hypothetical protein
MEQANDGDYKWFSISICCLIQLCTFCWPFPNVLAVHQLPKSSSLMRLTWLTCQVRCCSPTTEIVNIVCCCPQVFPHDQSDLSHLRSVTLVWIEWNLWVFLEVAGLQETYALLAHPNPWPVVQKIIEPVLTCNGIKSRKGQRTSCKPPVRCRFFDQTRQFLWMFFENWELKVLWFKKFGKKGEPEILQFQFWRFFDF